MHPIAIVGAGQAGATLAIALRQHGCRDPILLLGKEGSPPYERPPLSKELLRGTLGLSQLEIQRADLYAAQGIALHTGDPVEQIWLDRHQLLCRSGTIHSYARLVLATGSTPRLLSGLEPDGRVIASFRTARDAQWLRGRIQPGHRLVVVGAGLIGTELASAFSGRRAHITLVDPAERPMAHALVPELGERVRHLLEDGGIHLRLGDTVRREGTAENPVVLHTGKGGHLLADSVVVCVGTAPNTALARAAGLGVRAGILVDADGGTSHPDVYAIGDCAEFYHPAYGRHLRLEQTQHALGHACAVAARLCGGLYAYDAVPWSWTDVAGHRLALIGTYSRGDAVVWAGPPGTPGAVAVTGRAERAAGAQGFVDARTANRIRSALKAGKPMDEVVALCEAVGTPG